MNMTYNEVSEFSKTFNKLIKKDKILKKTNIEYGVAPTFLSILPARSMLKKNIIVGAQNAAGIEKGAYTSQISYSQLKEFDINYVILGHSEVRQYLHESDSMINAKALKLLNNKMVPIICIGESLLEYKKKKTIAVLQKQLTADCANIPSESADQVIIAYEPIWAIGTGKTPTINEIKTTCDKIRKIIIGIFGKAGNSVRILYGGSLKPENASDILALNNVDGGLIGGASMKAESLYKIITSCPEYIRVQKQNEK